MNSPLKAFALLAAVIVGFSALGVGLDALTGKSVRSNMRRT